MRNTVSVPPIKNLDNELGCQGEQFWSLFNFGELDGFHTNRNYQFYCLNNGRYAKICILFENGLIAACDFVYL